MKIPILLMTGFLGSGKTTLLKAFARKHPQLRMIFLVNEFAEHCVDELTLSDLGLRAHSVIGGSMFCECKAGDFIRSMREHVLQAHQKHPFDAVIIETSGIADPDAIGKLIGDHELSQYFEIRRIIAVVSPATLPKLIQNLPVIRSQIQTADLILINKVDLASESEIVETEALVAAENPDTEIMRTSWCEVDFRWDQSRKILPVADLATCKSNPFTTEVVSWKSQTSETQLVKWLENLPRFMLRVKGCVQTQSGWRRIEKTVDDQKVHPIDPQPASSLTLIVHDDDAEKLASFVNHQSQLIQS